MNILSDLFALYTAIAVTYVAAMIWRYTMSRPSLPESRLRAQMHALKKAVRAIYDSKDIAPKLAQIQVAIDIAKGMDCLLPAGSNIHEQTTQLEEMRTALSNDALRHKVNELSTQLRVETNDGQRQQLGQQLLALLAEEREKQLADAKLIAHYDATIQRYLEAREHTEITERASDDCADYVAEMVAAHDILSDSSLDSDIPDGVRFYQPVDTPDPTDCGQAVFGLTFEINGCRVDPDDLTHDLGRSVLRTIRRSISKRVHSIRCPEHGSAPRIVVTGQSLDDLSWDVRGCCAKLRSIVKQTLHSSR